jgi:hypothetical protein
MEIIIQLKCYLFVCKLNRAETNHRVCSSKTKKITKHVQTKYNSLCNSVQFIYVQNLTAQRPVTKLAQARKWEE